MKPINPLAVHFRQLAQAVLPRDGFMDVLDDEGGRVVLQSSWWLAATAPGVRPRSHPIRVIVTREALEDYAAAEAASQRMADQHFQDRLRARLGSHTTIVSQPISGPAPEEWVIGPLDLFPVPR